MMMHVLADLDSFNTAEALLLEIPAVDWTFGGMFPNSTTSTITMGTDAAGSSDGAGGCD